MLTSVKECKMLNPGYLINSLREISEIWCPDQWTRLLGEPHASVIFKAPRWFCLQPRCEPVVQPKVLGLTDAVTPSWVVSTHKCPGLYSRISGLFCSWYAPDFVQSPTVPLVLPCFCWVFPRDPQIPPDAVSISLHSWLLSDFLQAVSGSTGKQMKSLKTPSTEKKKM